MDTSLNNHDPRNEYLAFIAIDWADQKHVFSLQKAGENKKETGTLEQKPEVIAAWVAKLRERFAGGLVAVAVEQSRDQPVDASRNPGFREGPADKLPRTLELDRFRQSHGRGQVLRIPSCGS